MKKHHSLAIIFFLSNLLSQSSISEELPIGLTEEEKNNIHLIYEDNKILNLEIYEKVPELLSVSLGSNETTLLKLTSAYCSFPNGGKKIKPIHSWGGCDVDFEWQLPSVEYWIKKNKIL